MSATAAHEQMLEQICWRLRPKEAEWLLAELERFAEADRLLTVLHDQVRDQLPAGTALDALNHGVGLIRDVLRGEER